jgi:hypothetical protein
MLVKLENSSGGVAICHHKICMLQGQQNLLYACYENKSLRKTRLISLEHDGSDSSTRERRYIL